MTGTKGFLNASLLSAPKENDLTDSASYVFRNPFTAPADSIYLALENFVKIASYLEYDVIRDQDENVYFLAK